MWRNSPQNWGWLSRSMHWVSAVLVIGLYALGWYMVDLDYYDPWYRSGPFWHKSFGLLLVLLITARVINRLCDKRPLPVETHSKLEHKGAELAHLALYTLLIVAVCSGYLISTADGRGISFFDWFDVPALVTDLPDQEDLAGEIHEWSTDILIVLALVHGLAAIKHHFIDRDETLRRMLKG